MWNIDFEKFEQLQSQGISLDILYLLQIIKEEYEVPGNCPQIRLLLQKLERKLLVSNGKITPDGQNLLAFIEGENQLHLTKKQDRDSDFEKWWKAYPGTDTFKYKNKTFSGTRSLRVKKDDCKVKFAKILAEGEYTVDQLIAALDYEVVQKKEKSLKLNENKLQYMQNSLTYLIQRSFEGFLELIQQDIKIPETKLNTSNTVGI